MRTREEADQVAADVLTGIQRSVGLELAFSAETLERRTAWIYFFNSRSYLETGEPKDALAGNGPIVVPKSGGAGWIARTSIGVEDQVD